MSKGLFPERRVLWLPLDYDWQPPDRSSQFCCTEMAMALEHDCDIHPTPFECPDTLLVFHEVFGEYGLPIRDGGPSYLLISRCPFCGAKLPDSGRDAWFDAVEEGGFDALPFSQLPEELRSGAWRRTH